MGIEIVHDKYNFLFVRVAGIYKVLDFFRPVSRGTVFTDAYMPHAPQRLYKHKYTAVAVSDIFGIGFLCVTWAHGQGGSGFPKQLVRFFIHAHYRNSRFIRHLIDIQNVLHAGYKFGIFLRRDTPVVVSVGLEFIFLSTLRMVSLLIGISSSTRDFSSSSFSVHLEWPSGTGPQAICISFASVRPSALRRAAAEFGLIL